ncbi:hypothetical protein CPB83DRAFT_767892 [Crepidotus variabilis]|uniref:Uncharacterized protein n=1 Tax=Crepidotus variabilis TaxID=179855 RepID=A0A9P6JNT3_9AGAR|nr:hypothetical protein CPB83DRAFT_767892 [Crepidotus variabilis]
MATPLNLISSFTISPRAENEIVDTRTISQIVYSCLITLILCMSYCIRPNMSRRNASSWTFLKRKINIAFWLIISPELIISWALNQWYEGNKFAKKYSARGWTPAHGQFVVMGGLLLYRDDQPRQVLSPEKFASLLENGCIEFPHISEQDIKERGRSHPLLAFLAIIQVIWFIVQFITRLVQGYAVAQLEMATLALIVVNGLLLCVWWNKPLDTHDPIRIDLLRLPPPTPPNLPNPEDTSAGIKWDFAREKRVSKRIKAAFRSEDQPPLTSDTFFRRLFKSLVWAPLDFAEKVFTDYGELFLRLDTEKVPEGDTEIPLFYAPDTTDNLGPFLFATENILGSIFAVTHVSLWFAHFPTGRDRMVWRFCAIITSGLPLLFLFGIGLLLGVYVISLFFTNRWTDIMLKIMQGVAIVVVMLGFPTLLAARMALLVEAFICLGSVAPSVLWAVPWTNYIPHFS